MPQLVSPEAKSHIPTVTLCTDCICNLQNSYFYLNRPVLKAEGQSRELKSIETLTNTLLALVLSWDLLTIRTNVVQQQPNVKTSL